MKKVIGGFTMAMLGVAFAVIAGTNSLWPPLPPSLLDILAFVTVFSSLTLGGIWIALSGFDSLYKEEVE